MDAMNASVDAIFLSTPSARRATEPGKLKAANSMISIHALREEGDVDAGKATIMANLFLSTPSARRATFLLLMVLTSFMVFLSTPSARRATDDLLPRSPRARISIHALREEGDR